ncbi:Yip1-domain-containing protein [Histomonas meleagridis]|uniref:Yip1-domain-containing protein n=1 Tax=Histomonas meleagridis TaxID=135588 RepID=UPI00355A2A07|nr:Yip1-domain-containing protein [Histomonas meleagridis]KAH0800852.1 Yip1-domain-containing protein [Histomonas meleagridis]
MIEGDELGFIETPSNEQSLTGSMTKESHPNFQVPVADASTGYFASIIHGGFPDEPSLFEEMGIHNTNVKENLKTILLPMSRSQNTMADNNFLVGLLFFCFFAGALLLLGKVRFGMVYIIGITGFSLLYFLFKFMLPAPVESLGSTLFTALSYCTIPLAVFLVISFILRLRSPTVKIIFALPFVSWAGISATKYLLPLLNINDSKPLIFFPIFIFYSYMLLLPIA